MRRGVATVLLDAGGVLVEPDWAHVAGILGESGVPAEAGALAAADPRAKRDLDRPATICSTDDRVRGGMYYRAILRRAGVPDPYGATADAGIAALVAGHAHHNLWSAVPPGVPEALDRLRAAGLALAVVSNADGRIEGLLRDVDLLRRVDLVLDSGLLGFEKPDPRIFREALRRTGADPATTVHLGDYYEIDVVGARAAGIGAVLVDPSGANADRECERTPSLAAFAATLLAPR